MSEARAYLALKRAARVSGVHDKFYVYNDRFLLA